MTEKEKAMAYDEAIEKARKLAADLPNGRNDRIYHIWDLENIFPELKENNIEHPNACVVLEDFNGGEGFYKLHLDYLNKKQVEEIEEMIKTWNKESKISNENIKNCIGMCLTDAYEQRFKDFNVRLKDCLDWLEKRGEQKNLNIIDISEKEKQDMQEENLNSHTELFDINKRGEQKPADKVEPKFKVGDWIYHNNGYRGPYLITNINEHGVELDNNIRIKIKDCSDYYHLWTIQDAKDGDVLTSISFHSNCTFIFNGLDNWKFDEPNGDRAVATGYCCLTASADKMEFGIQGPDCIEVGTVKPATKEQRDLLFQKMKESGYEWDADKKELNKIHVIDEGKAEMDYCFTKMMNGEKVSSAWSEDDEKIIKRIDSLLYAINESDFEDIHVWLKSIKYRTQPKQEWSEEDENRINHLIAYFEDKEGFTAEDDIEYANWLKSLKGRTQPKQDWSEEEKGNVDIIISRLEVDIEYWKSRSKRRIDEDKRVIDWLKSFRPQK